MYRREFTFALGSIGAISCFFGEALAVPQGIGEQTAYAFSPNQKVPSLEELEARELAVTGPQSPYKSEVATGRKILSKMPPMPGQTIKPIDVAQWFNDLGEGKLANKLAPEYQPEWADYTREWPVRANPVIVSFFDATTLRTPVGDVTAWCAAFVNWCIIRSRYGRDDSGSLLPPTKSAASASFRNWGTETKSPRPGDLVVFRNKSDNAHGHVAFFLEDLDSQVRILGGNQRRRGAHNNGEINISPFEKSGNVLELHSYRTDPSLH